MLFRQVPFERLEDLGYVALFQPAHVVGRTPIQRFHAWKTEVKPWCEAEFGPMFGTMAKTAPPVGERWWTNGFSIYFATVEDATHFRLRWC